jgi:hypothetical protein
VIVAVQRIEHYEIAAYGTSVAIADALAEKEASDARLRRGSDGGTRSRCIRIQVVVATLSLLADRSNWSSLPAFSKRASFGGPARLQSPRRCAR